MEGLIIRSTGSWYIVRSEDGSETACRIRGKFRIQGIKSTNPVAVGDHVEWEAQEDGTGTIYKIKERKNYIIRKATRLSKQTHIIAANLDQAVLMATLARPRTSTGFIDRFLASAEAYSIPVCILFNKVDLYDKAATKDLESLMEVYRQIGYNCVKTSATKSLNLDLVKDILRDKVSLLAGHSGVGKSSLINAIEPSLELDTTELSDRTETGKHTTTFAQMFDLSFGGNIIDTPGIKSFGVFDFDKEEVFHFFREIFEISDQCKFYNCTHINEPDCAVKNAVQKSEIAEHRYTNYVNIYNGDDLDTEY